MKPPVLTGVVERRLLVNYALDVDVAARLLPAPFRPQVVSGHAVAGVCLIRLGCLRPRGLPAIVGVRSENAAHRFAVEWDTPGGPAQGVFIPRRDTNALLNTLIGGRLFPGRHHRASVHVDESASGVRVGFESVDGFASVDVSVTPGTFASNLFGDLDEASNFFERGCAGFSATDRLGIFDGLELRTDEWRVEPMEVGRVRSSYFDDPARFPPGSARLDHALLMRDVSVTWHPLGRSAIPRGNVASETAHRRGQRAKNEQWAARGSNPRPWD